MTRDVCICAVKAFVLTPGSSDSLNRSNWYFLNIYDDNNYVQFEALKAKRLTWRFQYLNSEDTKPERSFDSTAEGATHTGKHEPATLTGRQTISPRNGRSSI